MIPGDVFKAVHPGSPDFHPRIVCSYPDPQGRLLLVNTTDIVNESDHSCIFLANSHPAFTKDCVLKYRCTEFVLEAQIVKAIKDGLAKQYDVLTKAQWGQVAQGFRISRACKPYIRDFLAGQGLI